MFHTACSSALQAASLTTLVTLRPLLGVSDPLIPDLILGPRKALDFGELQQPVRRDTTRFFGTRSQVPTGWAAPAINPELPRYFRGSTGRAWTGDVAEVRGSWETAKFHTVHGVGTCRFRAKLSCGDAF